MYVGFQQASENYLKTIMQEILTEKAWIWNQFFPHQIEKISFVTGNAIKHLTKDERSPG